MLVELESWSHNDEMTLKEQVAYFARVSNPGNQWNHYTADKLVNYLIANKHWSPFEMVHITMYIETTRDIARQILRHRSFSFQEFSQRYAVVSDPYELREARLQDAKNRQNSIDTDDVELEREWTARQSEVATHAMQVYTWALGNGIAKEQARVVLPEGMTPSRMYMAGTLRSWLHYIDVRSDAGVQKEHRMVAEAVDRELEKIW